MKTNTSQTIANESGIDKIEQIKANISSCGNKSTCKAEVYEMWSGVFEPNEND